MGRIKSFIFVILAFATVSYAVDAFYRHHQRTVTTSLEADLVAREIGIDASARNSLIAKKADGNLIHILAKEMDTASLNGVLNVAGQTNLSGAVKMANYTSGRVPYFTTGGLITDAATFTYNGTTLAVNGITNTSLAGTGTRLTTSTSTGVQGNATSIDGANTWNGAQTFSASGTALDVTSTQSGAILTSRIYNAGTTAGSSARHLLFVGGTSAGDPYSLYSISGGADWAVGPDNSDGDAYVITPSTTPGGATNGLKITTAGAVTIPGTLGVSGNVTADSLISSKFYEEGSFTGTLTGCTTSPTGTIYYVRVGKLVQLSFPVLGGTSNATTMTITGLPTGLRPARGQDMAISAVSDNGNIYAGDLYLQTGGTFQVYYRNSLSAQPSNVYTSSGAKGIQEASVAYSLR